MRKMVYIFVLVAIFLLPSVTPAQDARARVEEILSYFPAGLYSTLTYYDFEAIKAAASYDLYNEHFYWEDREQKELAPLPKELHANASSLAIADRVRFRISGLKKDARGIPRPEILLDENGNYKRNLGITGQLNTFFAETTVVILNFGRIFRVYRIIALDELIKKAIKNGSMVQEDGSILGVPYYRIELNSAEVPFVCCSVEPDVLLLTEDKSMLEDLVAVSTGSEASLATEEFYDEVIFLGPELGPRWNLLNALMMTHRSVRRKLLDFGIAEELLDQRREDLLEGSHFSVGTFLLDSEIIEREIEICGSEEGAEKAMQFRKSHPRYSSSNESPEASRIFTNAYNAAWKIGRDGAIVTSEVLFDEDLITLQTAAYKAWDELREKMKKEKEAAAKKKENAEKK